MYVSAEGKVEVKVEWKAKIELSTKFSTELTGRRITGSVGLTGVFDGA